MASQSGSKRTRKGKGVAPSSSNVPSESDRFFDQEARAKFSSYKHKNIKVGRIVDEDSHLDIHGLDVGSLLAFQGLHKFLATDLVVFPTLVKEFYANLRHPVNGGGMPIKTRLISRVNAIDISFNSDELGVALELDSHNEQLAIAKFSDIHTLDPHCDILAALNTICREPRAHTSNVRATHLKLPCHIIHRILVHSINPRSGSFDQVPKFDIYLVWAIFTRKRIDWAYFIFSLFRNGAKRKDANLVFGIALSKLFYSYNVTEGAEFVKLSSDDYFTDTTIQRFGYEIVNDFWVRKGGAPPQDEPGFHEDDPMDDEADFQQHPSASNDPTNYDLMQAIQGLTMENRELRQDVQILREDVRRMDYHFNYRFDAFQGAFQAQWPDYVFPPPPPEDAP